MTFDIAGRKITARVTSIRRVDWRNSRTGFMVLFRPGVLENAPQTLIAPINGPENEVERSRFQRGAFGPVPEHIHNRCERHRAQRQARLKHDLACDLFHRRVRLCERRFDPHRIDCDDKVPARLRSGGLKDAGREAKDPARDSSGRVRVDRACGRIDRVGCGGGALLRDDAVLIRHSVELYAGDQFCGHRGNGSSW